MKKFIIIFCCLAISFNRLYAQSIPKKSFWVCGDSKVLLVDYNSSKDDTPNIIWAWDAKTADIPDEYRNRFKTVDDCKTYRDQVLISSSSGAVAIVNLKDHKTQFYAQVGSAHSVEMLPGGLLAAAGSTNAKGNGVFLFDINKGNTPVFKDSLYSTHGLVWDAKRQSLFVLSYIVLREYKLDQAKRALILKTEWKLPGHSGHDLQMAPDGDHLFVTQETGTNEFDIAKATFGNINGFANVPDIKSIGQKRDGQFIYTKTEQSWWTFHVRFLNPERVFNFPDMKVYKARWY